MTNVITADFGQRHLEEDLEPVMSNLIDVFIDILGRKLGYSYHLASVLR